jgi:hypothetical protein
VKRGGCVKTLGSVIANGTFCEDLTGMEFGISREKEGGEKEKKKKRGKSKWVRFRG